MTVILVTHYIDEAKRLCDRLALIDRGCVAAMDTQGELAAREGGGTHMRFLPSAPFADAVLTDLPEVSTLEHNGRYEPATWHQGPRQRRRRRRGRAG